MSCSVFHSDGAGKQFAHDRIQTSKSTFSTRSQSRLPMESAHSHVAKLSNITQQLNMKNDACSWKNINMK